MNKHLVYEEWLNKYKDYKDAYKDYVKLQSENDYLQFENMQLKKQKDDVVEYVKNRFDEEKGIWILDAYELLRMLGEEE